MGVDYNGIGGAGILITEDMIQNWLDKGLIDKELYDESEHVAIDDMCAKNNINYVTAGDGYYGGEDRYYLVIDGNTLCDCYAKAGQFVLDLAKIDMNISIDDIKIIEDIHVW